LTEIIPKGEPEVLNTEFAGFIAQEVQPLFPDAVQVDEDGFLNFNMHSILVASINAIKELNAREEELKTELKTQKELLEKVMQRLAALENK
jgi:trimeric autotransporter adhesin